MRMLIRAQALSWVKKSALLLTVILVLSAAGTAAYYLRHHRVSPPPPRTALVVHAPSPAASSTMAPSPVPSLPPSLLLQTVPFTVQAPFGWDQLHEEWCEAAAIYMTGQFLMRGDNRADLPAA